VAIATALTVSRLTRDTEITVMRSAGISLKRIFLPVFAAGLLLSFGDFWFGEHVVPWSILRYEQTMSEISRNIHFLVPQEGQAIQSPDRKYTVLIGRMEVERGSHQTKLYDVRIIANPTGVNPIVMLSRTADYNDGIWTLHNANIHIYEQGGLREKYILAKEEVINFRLSEASFNTITLQLPLYSSAADMSFHDMGVNLARERKNGWVNPHDLLEYNFKLSVPFSCLVFAIVCPPLALRFARAGNFMGVLLSIILVFVYWNTLLAARIIGTRYPGILPPFAAAWGQNVLFSGIGLFTLWREE
jgi:lipopolysaccharide export system permease protein